MAGDAFAQRVDPIRRSNHGFLQVSRSRGPSELHDFVRQLLGIELCVTNLACGMRMSGNEADTAACRKFVVVKGKGHVISYLLRQARGPVQHLKK